MEFDQDQGPHEVRVVVRSADADSTAERVPDDDHLLVDPHRPDELLHQAEYPAGITRRGGRPGSPRIP